MKEKQNRLGFLIESGATVYTHINPAIAGVVLPPHLLRQHTVCLVWGYNLPLPTLDMLWNTKGLSGTLEFKGVAFKVRLPWKAIFAIVNEGMQGKIWDGDIPLAKVVPIQSAKKQGKITHTGNTEKVTYLTLVR